MRPAVLAPVLLGLSLLAGCAGSSDEPRLATEPTLHVGEAALSGGNPTLALRVAEGILSHRPLNADALVLRGDAQLALGMPAEATTNYQRALRIAPNSVRAQLGLGRISLGSDPAAAEVLFRRALGNDPRSVPALNDLGIACDLQGRHADAQGYYRRAMALAPDNNATLVNLGLSLAMSGNKAEALHVLQPVATSPATTGQVRQNLAAALDAAGDADGAQRVLGAGGLNQAAP